MFRTLRPCSLLLSALLAGAAVAQETQNSPNAPTFATIAADAQKQLADGLADLAKLRERIAAERLPMDAEMRAVETELQAARAEFQRVSKALEARSLDLTNARTEIDRRRDQSTWLGNVLAEYVREIESGLHIAELQRHQKVFADCKLAIENRALAEDDVFSAEIAAVGATIERLKDALGGTRFQGTAVDAGGAVKAGTFLLLGPTALFRSDDGSAIGSAEQRLGSLEPTVVPFSLPEDTQAAGQLVAGTGGRFPLDPTLGSAHKIEAVQETLVEHFLKGGPVMWPILALASAALLVVLAKWLTMAFVRRPSQKLVQALLDAVERGDRAGAVERAETISGPAGEMLAEGARHLGEPRELVEEVMFEKVMSTRLRLQSWLPFVAICASSAPLLGLLGTVTGIMQTFQLMTAHGNADPKTLSSGISEALITTEYGLIVAIPSLLLHAFLSRRARGILDEMEKAAVAFVNRCRKAETATAKTGVA